MANLTDLKQPIAIRSEHIAARPTTIRVKQHKTLANMWTSGGDFIVSTYDDGTRLFSIDSEAAFLSQRRHFRDVSGLPLFELAMKKAGVTWNVHLPGAGSRSTMAEPIARIAPRWYIFKYKIDVYVRNSEAGANGEEVKLEVRGQDLMKSRVLVFFNEAPVMSIKRMNTSLPYDEYEWVADVSRGMDLSLVRSTGSYYRSQQVDIIITF